LVALQGWPFVTNEAVSTEATPAQIEKALHIPGGSLRPILKELKDSNFITAQGYSYHVRSVALSHIKSQIQKIISGAGSPRQSGKSKRKKGVAGESAKEVKRQPRKRASVPTGDKAQFFEQLVAGKFFEQPRKLADVKEAFHEKGHIVPSTSIPSYLLKAVRDEKLRRERKTMDGLKVWVYEKAK
ncbi:MAG: hypothetical protein HYY66_03370, partial [Candidatus Tectomicrobia bacterium]|nr:hypothetical protein [Candidatus Tectomicrobia bacterium]